MNLTTYLLAIAGALLVAYATSISLCKSLALVAGMWAIAAAEVRAYLQETNP